MSRVHRLVDPVDAVLERIGDLQAKLGASIPDATGDAPPDLTAYVGRPVEFITEVLGMKLLKWQKDWLCAFHAHRQFGVVSGNGAGKSHLWLALLVYVAAVLGGTAVYLSNSERQTRAQLMEKMKGLVEAVPAVSGDVFTFGAKLGDGVIYFAAAGEASAMQGYHSHVLLIVADEASALTRERLAALQSCAVGEDNWLVLSGNALSRPGDPFTRVLGGADPSWYRTTVSAYDVVHDPAAKAIPGLVTEAGINRLRQLWGEESPTFQQRVYARFQARSSESLFPDDAIEAAFARWNDPAFRERESRRRLTFGVDVGASSAGDESCCATARGGYVEELVTWREPDTMKTVSKVVEILERRNVARRLGARSGESRLLRTPLGRALIGSQPGDPLLVGAVKATVRVDEQGVGRGVSDRLREQGFPSEPFNSSKRPTGDEEGVKFQNQRAEAYSRLRTLMIQGRAAFPPDPLLREELACVESFTNQQGRLQIRSKAEMREALGRSPDRLDAVVQALAAPDVLDLSGYRPLNSDGSLALPI